MTKNIFIAGSGGIGEAVALLLREWADFETKIFLGDISAKVLESTKRLITENSSKADVVEIVLMPKEGINEAMKASLLESEILLDCSPGSQAPRMARFAKEFGLHYANLTEYVAETDEIMSIAADAETGFILQTGLAPGFINVLAKSLYEKFVAMYQVEQVERIAMKVGALSKHAHSPHFYGFTWSPIGVATEYVKNARVVRDFKTIEVPPLSDYERIIIDGNPFEADLTSGGAADLPEFFDGKVRNLEYKTLRHIGHYEWVTGAIARLKRDEDLSTRLLAEMLWTVPHVEEDFVMIHASVEGFDSKGWRRMVEKAYRIEPIVVAGQSLRAIQTTTAVPMIESAMMLLSGKYKGVILQSNLDTKEFLNGKFVSRIYKD